MNIEKIRLTKGDMNDCYDIPENDPDRTSHKDWGSSRRAVDVAIANKATDKAIREIVKQLEAWRMNGTHLISDEAIQALKKLEED